MQTQAGQDELQKAIDDITKTEATSGAEQPLAMPDPIDVGAPGQMPPAGATPIINSAGTATNEGAVDTSGPATGTNETNSGALPDLNAPVNGAQTPAINATSETTVPAPATEQTTETAAMPELNVNAMAENDSDAKVVPNDTPIVSGEMSGAVTDLEKVKADALRDLSPLMDKIEMAPEKKFHIYKEMMMANNDSTVVVPAYEAAKQIGDEQERGEALLSLIEYIDKSE